MKAATTSTVSKGPRVREKSYASEERDYQDLLGQLRGASGYPLFTTDAADLYDIFLAGLPKSRRQYYVCRTCRKFVDRFGGLVTIGEDGTSTPFLWGIDEEPSFFLDSIIELANVVRKARVNGIFLSSEGLWGTPSNRSPKAPHEDGSWHPLHVKPNKEMRRAASAIKSDDQDMAEKLEDRGILCRGLAEF